MKKNKKIFNVTYNFLTLPFELFDIDYIFDDLSKLVDEKVISSVYRFVDPQKKIDSSFKKLYLTENDSPKEKFHFFAYIKFFKCETGIYGLVGGKTNYPNPDVLFDYLDDKNDNRIARTFLEDNKYEWHNEILIINHEPFLDRALDNRQALYLESFLQRKYNLFNS